MPCFFTGCPDGKYFFKFFLHQPFEIMVEKSVNGPYVVCSLMICHEHVTFSLIDILAAYHFDAHKKYGACETRPVVCRPITPEISVADRACDHREYRGEQCGDNENRASYQILVKQIEEAQESFHVCWFLIIREPVSDPYFTGLKCMESELSVSLAKLIKKNCPA